MSPGQERLLFKGEPPGLLLARQSQESFDLCLVASEDVSDVAWSGDGRYLATVDSLDDEITIIDTATGHSPLPDEVDLRGGVATRPEGFVVLDDGELVLIDFAEGEISAVETIGVATLAPGVPQTPEALLALRDVALVRLAGSTLDGQPLLLRDWAGNGQVPHSELWVVTSSGEQLLAEAGGNRGRFVGNPDPRSGAIPVLDRSTCGAACGSSVGLSLVDPGSGVVQHLTDTLPPLPADRWWSVHQLSFGRDGQMIAAMSDLPDPFATRREPGPSRLLALRDGTWVDVGQPGQWGETSASGVLAVIRGDDDGGRLEIVAPDGTTSLVAEHATWGLWSPS